MDIDQLSKAATALHPALVEATSIQAWLSLDLDNADIASQQIYAVLQGLFPKAGKHYWRARLWQLISWQPIWLTVAASESLNRVFFPQHLRLKFNAELSIGWKLATSDANEAPQLTPESNPERLIQYLVALHNKLPATVKPSTGNTMGMVADSLMVAVLAATKNRGYTSAEQSIAGKRWCLKAGLTDHHLLPLSTILQVPYSHIPKIVGDSESRIQRRSCCKHYLRLSEGTTASRCKQQDFCGNCPLVLKHIKAFKPHQFSQPLAKQKKYYVS